MSILLIYKSVPKAVYDAHTHLSVLQCNEVTEVIVMMVKRMTMIQMGEVMTAMMMVMAMTVMVVMKMVMMVLMMVVKMVVMKG